MKHKFSSALEAFLFYSRAKKWPMREEKRETRNKIRHGEIAGLEARYWKFGRAINLSLWRHRQLKLQLMFRENVKLFVIHKSVVWVVFNCWVSFGFDVARCLKGPNTCGRIYSPGWIFSSVSWTNLLKKTSAITWREFQPGRKIPAGFHKPGWKFQPGQTGWETSCNRIQISARAEISNWACAPFELWM